MLSAANVNIRKKTKKTEVLLNRQSKRTRNVIKSISDREIYQLVMHEKNSSPRYVTKFGVGLITRRGGGDTLSVTCPKGGQIRGGGGGWGGGGGGGGEIRCGTGE